MGLMPSYQSKMKKSATVMQIGPSILRGMDGPVALRVKRGQLCGGGEGLARERRSAMNWSNSALSFAIRKRPRNS
jgi:hypothetical protein